MIDFELVDIPVDLDSFNDGVAYPALFYGAIIKNKYDNKRIQLNSKYSPIRILHPNKDSSNLFPLYGLILTPNNLIRTLMSVLLNQELSGEIHLVDYKNILHQFDLSCDESYSWYDSGVYPVDFKNLKNICTDKFNSDSKFLQHILNLDENKFDFQKFASLNLFILTPFNPNLIK